MADSSPQLSPQERLNLSRRALVRHMSHDRDQHRSARQGHPEASFDDMDPEGQEGDEGWDSGGAKGMWHAVSGAVANWWRAHPAHLAVEVAEPVLERYAARHPLKLLAGAAALGALVVMARPWRLISLTGMAVAALKSTQASSLVASLIRRSGSTDADERTRRPDRKSRRS